MAKNVFKIQRILSIHKTSFLWDQVLFVDTSIPWIAISWLKVTSFLAKTCAISRRLTCQRTSPGSRFVLREPPVCICRYLWYDYMSYHMNIYLLHSCIRCKNEICIYIYMLGRLGARSLDDMLEAKLWFFANSCHLHQHPKSCHKQTLAPIFIAKLVCATIL